MIDKDIFFEAVLSSCCDWYNTNHEAVRAKYSARNPPPHSVMMVRGCFIGLLSSISISKAAASRFININRVLAGTALDYYKQHQDKPQAEELINAIKSALNDKN